MALMEDTWTLDQVSSPPKTKVEEKKRFKGVITNNRTGPIYWDTDNPQSIRDARVMFDNARMLGLMIYDYSTGYNMPSAEVKKGFNPETAPDNLAIYAPMAGG